MAKFIKLTILHEDRAGNLTNETPALVNLERIECFRKGERCIEMYYNGKDPEGLNHLDYIKEPASVISKLLEGEAMIVKL